jgi:uncharacterized protein (UPF0335 family)
MTARTDTPEATLGGAQKDLKNFFDRILRIREEKRALQQTEREIFQEAKSKGFNVALMREALKLAEKKKEDLDEREQMLAVYLGILQS